MFRTSLKHPFDVFRYGAEMTDHRHQPPTGHLTLQRFERFVQRMTVQRANGSGARRMISCRDFGPGGLLVCPGCLGGVKTGSHLLRVLPPQGWIHRFARLKHARGGVPAPVLDQLTGRSNDEPAPGRPIASALADDWCASVPAKATLCDWHVANAMSEPPASGADFRRCGASVMNRP